MTAVATREREARQPAAGSAEPPAKRLFEPEGPTLEDAILATWHELESSGTADCPACGDAMSRAGGCRTCRAELS